MKYLNEFLLNNNSNLRRVSASTNLCIFNTGKTFLNITIKNTYLNECATWYSHIFLGESIHW